MVAVPEVSTSVAAEATSPGSPAACFCVADLAFALADGDPVTAPSGFDVPLGSTPDGFTVGTGRLTEGSGTGLADVDVEGVGVGVGVGDEPKQIPRMQVWSGADVAALACWTPVTASIPVIRASESAPSASGRLTAAPPTPRSR